MSNVYCSQDQFAQRFDARLINQLSTVDDTATPVSTNVDAALDDAASLLDSYIIGRFSLASDGTIPAILTRWVAVKAIDNMFGRRAGMPDWIAKELEWAEKWLEDVVMGKASIPTAARSSQPKLQASESMTGRSRGDRPAFLDEPPTCSSTSGGRI